MINACILILIVAISASTSQAESLTFAVGEFKPHHYIESDTPKGICVEIVEAACERLGIEPEYTFYPWKRALALAQEGKIEAFFSLYHTSEREEFLYFTDVPLLNSEVAIFGLKGRDDNVTELSQISDMKILQILGTSYPEEVQDIIAEFDMTFFRPDIPSMIDLLVGRPGHVAIINATSFNCAANSMGVDNKIITLFSIQEQPLFLAFPKANGEKAQMYANKFSVVLKELHGDGTIEKIIKKNNLD